MPPILDAPAYFGEDGCSAGPHVVPLAALIDGDRARVALSCWLYLLEPQRHGAARELASWGGARFPSCAEGADRMEL